MKNSSTWKLIDDSLTKGIGVLLLYVLESSGSSPGRQGFFMAVNANGEMEGSIGGGIMEHKFVEMAKERLREQEIREQEIRKQYHDKSVARNQSGMICSGEQTILLYHLQPGDAVTIQSIIQSLEQNKNGTLHLSPSGLNFSSTVADQDFHFIMHSENEWEYVEKTGYKNQLFIIGGGHCSLAFSKLMRSLDFYIRLYDDRKDLKTVQANDYAHEKYFIDDYSQLNKLITSGSDHYVVIMTFGYRTDDIALRSLWDKEFKYLGLLGSANKTQKMFDEYRKEGVAESILKKIYAPVGLLIKSQTPEEIAVSIAAEIIQVKNQAIS
ncbi:MAG TPA: XdhC family protein [Chitinophagaceae bacterium]|nr:XdhC family protein [Chitinophagaceae bacterium]